MAKKTEANYEPRHIQKLQIYFTDNRDSRIVKNVRWYGTSGGLLHIITNDGEQAWPLSSVFNIRILERKDNPKAR